MVRLKVALAASPGRALQLLDALRFLIGETRLEGGCLMSVAWVDRGGSDDRESTVHYLEEWASEQDLRQRVLSDAFTSLLSVMEAATRAPHVEFDLATACRGLDYVVEVRQELGPVQFDGLR